MTTDKIYMGFKRKLIYQIFQFIKLHNPKTVAHLGRKSNCIVAIEVVGSVDLS